MMLLLKEKVNLFLKKGNERTVLAKKNIAASFMIKGGSILISLVLVPLTLNYVNPERNGIWLTLQSLVMWLYLSDIGLGNGMRNKLAEANAKGDHELARKYISSTYAIVGMICLGFFILFHIVNPYLDWMELLGPLPASYTHEVVGIVKLFIIAFCLNFSLNLLKPILIADQKPAIASLIDFIGQVFIFVGIFILTKTVPASLISLGLVSLFLPILITLIASVYLFSTKYKRWRPSLRYVDFRLGKNMMNLGIKFFIATIAAFLITYTLPFFIQRIAGPTDVTYFNTTFRLFTVAYNIVNIIVFPIWSLFTDAYTKQDHAWMQNTVQSLHKLYIAFIVVELILLFLSPFIYHLWINNWMKSENTLHISFALSVCVCLYTSVLCWLNMHIYPLNGIGKVKLQVYSSIVEIILFIPLVLWLGNWLGTIGVVMAPIVVYLPRMIWAPVQLHKLVHQTSKGIWDK